MSVRTVAHIIMIYAYIRVKTYGNLTKRELINFCSNRIKRLYYEKDTVERIVLKENNDNQTLSKMYIFKFNVNT